MNSEEILAALQPGDMTTLTVKGEPVDFTVVSSAPGKVRLRRTDGQPITEADLPGDNDE